MEVRVRASDEKEWVTTSQDISRGGMFLMGSSEIAIGSEITLQFELPKLGQVSVPGFIRWTTTEGFGVQFGLLGARETHAIGALVRDSVD